MSDDLNATMARTFAREIADLQATPEYQARKRELDAADLMLEDERLSTCECQGERIDCICQT